MPIRSLAKLCLLAMLFSGCARQARRFAESCGANAECESGRCQANLCAASCQSSEECGEDLCFDNACVPASSVPCTQAAACIALLPVGGCRSAVCTAGHCEEVGKVGQTCKNGLCNGQCLDKVCQPSAKTCDDNNLCTEDACNPLSGCSHAPRIGPCTDHDLCTGDKTCKDVECLGDFCEGGVCHGGDVRLCQPPICTTTECQPALGCVFTPIVDGPSRPDPKSPNY